MDPPPPPDPRMAEIYNSHARMPLYRTTGQERPQVTGSEISRMHLDAYIDKSRVLIVENQKKVFELSVWLSSKVMCQVFIGLYCREENNQLVPCFPSIPTSLLRANFYPTTGQDYKVQIDLSSLDYSQMFTGNLVHVYIDIFSIAAPNCPVLRTFFQFCRNKEKISLMLKKQVIIINGVPTVLLDFYGMETNGENLCLICLTENRDTMILPCRHVCLCRFCSERLSDQFNKNCPICRTKVGEFIRIIE